MDNLNVFLAKRRFLDFAAIFDTLADIEYDGFATLELYAYQDDPVRAAEKACDRLESLI